MQDIKHFINLQKVLEIAIGKHLFNIRIEYSKIVLPGFQFFKTKIQIIKK